MQCMSIHVTLRLNAVQGLIHVTLRLNAVHEHPCDLKAGPVWWEHYPPEQTWHGMGLFIYRGRRWPIALQIF